MTRISEVEECISVHHVREFTRRIMQIEARIGGTGGIIGDTLRHCLVRLESLDQCAANLDDLRERMRTQNGIMICQNKKVMTRYSECSLSMILVPKIVLVLRIVQKQRQTQTKKCCTTTSCVKNDGRKSTRVLQPQEDVQMPEAHEGTLQQRLQRLTVSQRRSVEDSNQVNYRVDQLRHDFRETMVESALTIQSVMQEIRGQGQGIERIRHVLVNIAMDKLEGIDFVSRNLMRSCIG